MDKRTEIKNAIESGEFSRNEIDPKTHGKYAGFLMKGKAVGEGKVDEMHACLVRLRVTGVTEQVTGVTERVTGVTEQVTGVTEQVTGVTEQVTGVTERVTDTRMAEMIAELQTELQTSRTERETMRQEISSLRAEVESLKSRAVTEVAVTEVTDRREPVTEVTDNRERRPSENVLGFTLALAEGYWYASRRIDGRNCTVYIGRDKTKAEGKIRAKFPDLVREDMDKSPGVKD